MSLVNNLLQSAAVIRDATQEGENTAIRVGGFLVSLIEAIVSSLPDTVVDGDVIGTQATDSSIIITLRTKSSDGQSGVKQITLPAASTATAGVMTPADRNNLNTAIGNAAQALLKVGQNETDILRLASQVTEDISAAINPIEKSVSRAYVHIDALWAMITPFKGILETPVEVVGASTTPREGDLEIYYHAESHAFIAGVTSEENTTYFGGWRGRENYMNGSEPWGDRYFLCTADGCQYRWDGTSLVKVGEPLMLGETEGTAYDGAAGKATAEKVDVLESTLGIATRNITESKGAPNGIAPLDGWGKVPAEHLPDSVGNALICFAEIVGQTQVGIPSSGGGIVVRDGTVTPTEGSAMDIVYNARTNRLIARLTTRIETEGEIAEEVTYYRNWSGGELYGTPTDNGRIPYDNKIYYCEADSVQYRYVNGVFERMGSPLEIGETEGTAYDGAKGKANAEAIATLATGTATALSQLREDTEETLRDMEERLTNLPTVGNDFNVTDKRTKTGELRQTESGLTKTDTLATAIAYAISKVDVVPGMRITFVNPEGTLKSYAYTSLDTSQVTNESNWRDLAAMSAGDEAVVNINTLCPQGGLNGFFTLSSALMQLREYEQQVGVIYRKKNLILTFRTADGQSEAKQYKGDSLTEENFFAESNWDDFGKGSVASIKVNGSVVVPDADGTVNISIPEPEVDATLDEQSTHPVQNAAIAEELSARKRANITEVQIVGSAEDGYQLKTLNAMGEELDSLALPSGGGGGDTSDAARIVLAATINNEAKDQHTIREGGAAMLQYSYSHQYSTGENAGQETGADCSLQVTVKNGVATTYETTMQGVTSGTYELDLAKYMRTGNNMITLQCTLTDPNTGQEKRKQIQVKVKVCRLTLSSTYDLQNSIRGGGYRPDDTMVIPFAVLAQGKKDIHVVIDGVEDMGRKLRDYSGATGEIRISMTGLSLGRHNVQIYATQSMGDLELQSETVFIDFLKQSVDGSYASAFIGTKMTLPAGNVLLATAWREPTIDAPQYEQVGFDLVAYDPDNVPATVEVRHNGTLSQTFELDRKGQLYTNRFTEYGRDEMVFTCGGVEYTIHVNVVESTISISDVRDSIVLDLKATGRSNAESNPAQWAYEDIHTEFIGFDWIEGGSGWYDNSLQLLNGAEIRIGDALLATNATTNGFTYSVEMQVSNVIDRDGMVLDNMDDDGVGIRIKTEDAIGGMSGGEQVATKYTSGEFHEFTFAVAPVSSGRRLLSLYVDGVHDRTVKYDSSSAMRNALRDILITSESADVRVRRMRHYSRCLTDDEILNNYIVSRTDTTQMVTMFVRNDVLSDDQRVEVEKLRQKGIAVLIFYGTEAENIIALMMRKDKNYQMRGTVEFYSPYGREFDFRAVDVIIQIQGTSSLTYPICNFDLTFDELTKLWINGVLSTDNLYAMRPGARPTNIFCLKADFCDSSGTHNTGAVKTINDLFKACGWLTPPQQANQSEYDVRTAIDAFPIVVFNDNVSSGDVVFAGKYNICNEKKDCGNVYGFEGIEGYNDEAALAGQPNPCICLEFLENGQPLALFQNADFDSIVDSKGTCAFDKALELRFPKNGKSKIKWAQCTDYQKNAIRRLWEWVVSCHGNPAKFLAEYQDYFLNEAPFAQTLLANYFMAVDDLAKNMMLVTWDGIHWMFIPYDWDCLFGLNNVSKLKYDYDIDETTFDAELNNYAFAGHDSELWALVRACPQKLAEVAGLIRSKLSVASVKLAFSEEYQAAWCERIYNKDEIYKYINPAFVDPENPEGQPFGEYLFAVQGNRKAHRDYIIENRFALLDSYYGVGDFRGNAQKIYLFGNFASDPRTIGIRAFEKFGFAYGSNNADPTGKVIADSRGAEVQLTITSNLSANDPQNIYGADRIDGLDLTNIADKIVGELSLAACKRLRDLDMTNAGNDAMTMLDLTGNRILRSAKLNGLNSVRTLDLSKNRKLETLEANRTGLTAVSFAPAGAVSRAALPASLQSLSMVGLPTLTLGEDGLTAESWANLTTLQAERLGAMNPVALLRMVLSAQESVEDRKLRRVRIGGSTMRGDGSELLALISRGVAGVTNDDKPEVSGIYSLIKIIEQSDMDAIEEGIEGITLAIVIEAYINAINEVNGESYGGMEEVEDVTVDNIDELALRYYNGETYEQWLERYAQDNANINSTLE